MKNTWKATDVSEHHSITTADDALELARQRTGLTEIETDSWREGLTVLIEEMNASTKIAPHGITYLTDNIVEALHVVVDP